MAQRRPISHDPNFVGASPPEGVSPAPPAPPPTSSSQPISRDPNFAGRRQGIIKWHLQLIKKHSKFQPMISFTVSFLPTLSLPSGITTNFVVRTDSTTALPNQSRPRLRSPETSAHNGAATSNSSRRFINILSIASPILATSERSASSTAWPIHIVSSSHNHSDLGQVIAR